MKTPLQTAIDRLKEMNLIGLDPKQVKQHSIQLLESLLKDEREWLMCFFYVGFDNGKEEANANSASFIIGSDYFTQTFNDKHQ